MPLRRPWILVAIAALVAVPWRLWADALPALPDGLLGPDQALRCLPYDGADPSPQQKRLMRVIARIDSLSDGDDPLLAPLEDGRIRVCLNDRLMDASGYYTPGTQSVVLGESLADPLLFVILVHELRHVDQFSRGFCPSTDYAVEENLRLTFALEADAQAIASLYAWQARSAGYPEAWTMLTSLDRYDEIAVAFAEAMDRDGSIESAVSTAFDAWYGNALLTSQYFMSACGAYYDALDEKHVNPSYSLLPADYFDDLCLLPSGGRYECAIRTPVRP